VRLVLGAAAMQLPPAGATWRDLAEVTCVGYSAARETVRNMVAAGELIVIGSRPVEGARRPMSLYAPRPAAPAGPAPTWSEFK
jgi:hypothetical protein